MTAREVITAIGNGDYEKGLHILEELATRLGEARQKHSWKGYLPLMGWEAILSEIIELWDAINRETPERQHDEALDVSVTAIRFLLKEWE